MQQTFQRAAFTCLLIACMATSFAGPARWPLEVASVLTKHQWFLVELLQTEKDVTTNMTLLMMPCEKDNYLAFSDGTYQINEGEIKCNTEDLPVKGAGTWSYNAADSTITDSYETGRKVYKRILLITDDALKVQFEGEGGKTFTLTYASAAARTTATSKDDILDPSNPAHIVIQNIKEYLTATNRYVLATRKELAAGTPVTTDDKNGLLPTVVVMPAMQGANGQPVPEQEMKSTLITQANKTGVDYVIAVNLKNSKLSTNEQNKPKADVSYEVQVLDVATSLLYLETFTNAPKAKNRLGGINMGKVIEVARKASDGLWTAGCLLIRQTAGLQLLYAAYFANNAISKAADVNRVFSNVNSAARELSYQQSVSVIHAIDKTTENMREFVATNAPVRINIASITGSGRSQVVALEAGSNIQLEKGEELLVVQLSNGKELGKLEVEKATSSTAIAVIDKGKDAIMEAFNKTPKDVTVVTTLKKDKK